MKQFFVNIINNNIEYSAEYIFEIENNIFLIESNKKVTIEDIIKIDINHYDIKDNDFYIMIIINKLDNSIITQYGYFSYCHSLYYYVTENMFHLNLYLKELIKSIPIKPQLNKKYLDEFVRCGFNNNDKCLIKDINKIPVLKTLIYKNNQIEIIDSQYIKNNSCGNYIDNLNISLPNKNIPILIPLSGGFDSTLLIYLVKDYNNKIAFTLGCNEDKQNEFKTAENTSNYLNIEQYKVYSDSDWITYLPKIVNIMEGEMFDTGVFLSYVLVDQIKNLGKTNYTVLTGDGADQLLNYKYYLADIEKEANGKRYDGSFLYDYPKHFLYYLIVKKLEWLLREENIDYITPFITSEFYDCAKDCKSLNKKEYKTFVKNYLPQEISEPLTKNGGLVREQFLLSSNLYMRFKNIINLPKYKDWFTINDNNLKLMLYKMYIIIFNYIFIENQSIDVDFSTLLNNLEKE